MNSLLLKKYFLFIVVYFLFISQNFSQTTIENDSLSKYSFKELHDKTYAAKPDSLKALVYAKYHLKKALHEKDTIKIASSYYIISSITKDTTSFINYWVNILKISNSFIKVIGNLSLGDFYFQNGNKDKALKKFINAKNISLGINEDSLNMISTFRIGIMKVYDKEYYDAIKHFKYSLNYFDKNSKKRNLDEYYSILLNLSSSFSSLKNYDSAHYYNNKLNSIAKLNNDSVIIGYSLNSKGNILYQENKFWKSINFIKYSLHYIELDENYIILSKSYIKLANSYLKLRKTKNAIKYYLKVDSLFKVTNNFYKSQKPAYKYLLEHYKEQNNDVKHLEYINKYITVDSVLNARSKSISKNLTENYDIPNLIAEKEAIEKRLNAKLATSRKYVWLISMVSIIISLFLIFQYRRRKLYKERFKQLLEQPLPKKPIHKSTKKEHGIPNETFEKIKQQLFEFENKQLFISREVSLSYLAKEFQTNSKYLSQVINQEKEQSFNNYINQLRIQYTVEKLKFDTTFRKFSIKAIAYEVGFNTTESFSKAFFKFTGIKPSYFIKELNNQ